MIIHGDNLEALKALPPEYEGKVDCIYIDPPYNTGNLERPTRADRRAMRRADVDVYAGIEGGGRGLRIDPQRTPCLLVTYRSCPGSKLMSVRFAR